MIKILIADDHHLFREGLARILSDAAGMRVIASVKSGEEALIKAAELTPDVILMDIHMPGIGGLEAARQIRISQPDASILMLTVSEQESDLFTAVRLGARGYLLKNTSGGDLLDAIRRVHAGEAIIAPVMAVKLLDEFASLSTMPKKQNLRQGNLSPREREVLALVAQGLRNKEIGENLSISPHTVKAHLRSILDKLHLRTRAEAAAWAATHGMVESNQ